MALRVIGLVLTIVLLGAGLAQAGLIASGAVRLSNGDSVDCIASNIGTRSIKSVTVSLKFSTTGGGTALADVTCSNVAPGSVCIIKNTALADEIAAFCEISFSGRVRGTFCNVTQGLCADTR